MIYTLPVTDYFLVNSYFLIDDQTKSGFLIDPGAQANLILKTINDNNWTIEKILLTHGHFDHTGAVTELKNKLEVPVFAHSIAQRYLLDPVLNLSRQFVGDKIVTGVQKIDSPRISSISGLFCDILETPGHSQDSISYYFPQEKAVIVGDLFYQHGFGLTHFPEGDAVQLKQSVKKLLDTLPDETTICSGHSAPITVFQQKIKLGMTP